MRTTKPLSWLLAILTTAAYPMIGCKESIQKSSANSFTADSAATNSQSVKIMQNESPAQKAIRLTNDALRLTTTPTGYDSAEARKANKAVLIALWEKHIEMLSEVRAVAQTSGSIKVENKVVLVATISPDGEGLLMPQSVGIRGT